MKTYYTICRSPLGDLLLTSADGVSLSGLYIKEEKHSPVIETDWNESADLAIFAQTRTQLDEYFSGTRTEFSLALNPIGTKFQNAVWTQLTKIPFGETITYGQLAKQVGYPRAARAVGQANGRNPISIIVPCHRVIGSNGTLTGYAGGLDRKDFLIKYEVSCTE